MTGLGHVAAHPWQKSGDADYELLDLTTENQWGCALLQGRSPGL